VAQAVSRLTGIDPEPVHIRLVGKKVALEQGSILTTSIFPGRYHPKNAAYSSLSLILYLPEGQAGKPGYLQIKQSLILISVTTDYKTIFILLFLQIQSVKLQFFL
jgi:hypothetical protein